MHMFSKNSFAVLNSIEEVDAVLDSAKVDNAFYNKIQFEKYFGDSSVRWLLLHDSIFNPKAMIAWKRPLFENLDSAYVCEIQAFQSGHAYGKKILEFFIAWQKDIWLLADVDGGKKLLDFYRRIDCLKEVALASGQHAFYSGQLGEKSILEFQEM